MLEDLEIKDYKLAKMPIDSRIKLIKDLYRRQVYLTTKK